MIRSATPLLTVAQRRRAVTFALHFTQGTALEADIYERDLLEHFVEGTLQLEEILRRLEQRSPAPKLQPAIEHNRS